MWRGETLLPGWSAGGGGGSPGLVGEQGRLVADQAEASGHAQTLLPLEQTHQGEQRAQPQITTVLNPIVSPQGTLYVGELGGKGTRDGSSCVCVCVCGRGCFFQRVCISE